MGSTTQQLNENNEAEIGSQSTHGTHFTSQSIEENMIKSNRNKLSPGSVIDELQDLDTIVSTTQSENEAENDRQNKKSPENSIIKMQDVYMVDSTTQQPNKNDAVIDESGEELKVAEFVEENDSDSMFD